MKGLFGTLGYFKVFEVTLDFQRVLVVAWLPYFYPVLLVIFGYWCGPEGTGVGLMVLSGI